MPKATPFQEQLLKAGLVKKSQVADVVREQNKARHGKQPAAPSDIQRDAERARADKADRDRALAAGHKARARAAELASQARRIVEDKKVPLAGELEYRFSADGAIRTVLVDDSQRRQLSSGALVIARFGDRYALLPVAAADKVRERDAGMIVLDHGTPSAATPVASTSDDDAYYAQFKVPDDLTW